MRMSAHIMNLNTDVNRRMTARRALMLDAVAHHDENSASDINIQNLSQTGLLMESSASFSVGEIFYLHLPEMGATPAKIRWSDGQRYGCEFLTPVGKGVISAALLKSTFEQSQAEVEIRAEQRLAATRFFADQVLPINQNGTNLLYMMSGIFTLLVAAVMMMMINGDIFIN